MNWIALLIGAGVMWILGFIYKNPTDISVAMLLVWIGLATKIGR